MDTHSLSQKIKVIKLTTKIPSSGNSFFEHATKELESRCGEVEAAMWLRHIYHTPSDQQQIQLRLMCEAYGILI